MILVMIFFKVKLSQAMKHGWLILGQNQHNPWNGGIQYHPRKWSSSKTISTPPPQKKNKQTCTVFWDRKVVLLTNFLPCGDTNFEAINKLLCAILNKRCSRIALLHACLYMVIIPKFSLHHLAENNLITLHTVPI